MVLIYNSTGLLWIPAKPTGLTWVLYWGSFAILESFAESNTIICADHGDCWDEDNLWGHGMHHEKVLEVPLVIRLTSDYDSDLPFFQKLIIKLAQSIA
jgi:hypothetical protein